MRPLSLPLTFCITAAGVCASMGWAEPDGILLYGQLNKLTMLMNDGTTSEVMMMDNNLSSTRWGLKAEHPLPWSGLTAGAWLENGMSSNGSGSQTQNSASGQSATPLSNVPAMSTRQANVSLRGNFGALTLGRLSTASDGSIGHDLTGVQDLMGAEWRLTAGGLAFRRPDNALTGMTVSALTDPINTNRTQALRYDSPIVNGWQTKTAAIQGGNLDAALAYTGQWGEFKVDTGAAVLFVNDASSTAVNRVATRAGASFSMLHENGLGFSVAASTAGLENTSAGAENPLNLYAKLGYTVRDWQFALDHNTANYYQNPATESNELSTWGAGAQYNLMPGVSLAAVYRQITLADTATPTEKIRFGALNMRIRF